MKKRVPRRGRKRIPFCLALVHSNIPAGTNRISPVVEWMPRSNFGGNTECYPTPTANLPVADRWLSDRHTRPSHIRVRIIDWVSSLALGYTRSALALPAAQFSNCRVFQLEVSRREDRPVGQGRSTREGRGDDNSKFRHFSIFFFFFFFLATPSDDISDTFCRRTSCWGRFAVCWGLGGFKIVPLFFFFWQLMHGGIFFNSPNSVFQWILFETLVAWWDCLYPTL